MRTQPKPISLLCLVILALLAAGAGAEQGQTMLVDNFEDGDTQGPAKTPWYAHNDSYLEGGASSSALRIVEVGSDGSTKALRLEGEVKAGFNAPFAGTNLVLDAEGSAHDLSAYSGLRFRVRGTGGQYLAQILTTTVQDFNEFSKSFEVSDEWQLIEIPFDELAQSPYWGQQVEWNSETVRGVAFQTGSALRGEFFLELDDIEFFAAP